MRREEYRQYLKEHGLEEIEGNATLSSRFLSYLEYYWNIAPGSFEKELKDGYWKDRFNCVGCLRLLPNRRECLREGKKVGICEKCDTAHLRGEIPPMVLRNYRNTGHIGMKYKSLLK